MSAVRTLGRTLHNAGIPYVSVRPPLHEGRLIPQERQIEFAPETSEEQKKEAWRLYAEQDWRARHACPHDHLEARVQALPDKDQQALLLAVAAKILREHSDLAARFGIDTQGPIVSARP